MGKQKNQLGSEGEKAAVKYLLKQGYRIISRNFRCRLGELDLIAMERDELVFVEVRTRSTTAYGLPEETVDWRKQARIRTLASYYLARMAGKEPSCRFDVISILWCDGEIMSLTHLKNAF